MLNLEIKPGEIVVVTGANGYIGSNIANEFLLRGYLVRGTVRDTTRCAWLTDYFAARYGPDRFELVHLPDLGDEASYGPVLDSASALLITTSATDLDQTDPAKAIPPAVQQTLAPLAAAAKHPSIKSVVLTGSAWAVSTPGLDNAEDYDDIDDIDAYSPSYPTPYLPRSSPSPSPPSSRSSTPTLSSSSSSPSPSSTPSPSSSLPSTPSSTPPSPSALPTKKPNPTPLTLTPQTYNTPALRTTHTHPSPPSLAVYMSTLVAKERAAWSFQRTHRPTYRFNVILVATAFGPILCPRHQGVPSSARFPVGLLRGSSSSGPEGAGSARSARRTLPPQHFVAVADAARLHVAAAVKADVESERIFAFAARFGRNDVLAVLRGLFPERVLVGDEEGAAVCGTRVGKEGRGRAEGLLREMGRVEGWVELGEAVEGLVGGLDV